MTDFSSARQKMVDGQVRPSNFTDLRIVEAMLSMPRELFVPEARRALAYLDLDLDVSAPGAPKRFLLKPAVLARLLQAAEVSEDCRILVAGCATGYSAALASRLAREVVATESDPALAAAAEANLKQLGATNVTVLRAPVTAGAPDRAPFDVILLDGATEVATPTLYEQLKLGGRLVGVFATTKPPRAEMVTRSPADFGNRPLFDAYAAVLPGLERPPAFVF
jgi:protein-L-isoaspartate(D-aspartate) O-methyltransferase